jgi:hypothetical protein
MHQYFFWESPDLRCVYTIEQSAEFKRRVCSSSKLIEQKGLYGRFARRELVKYAPSKLVEHRLCSIVETHLKKLKKHVYTL